MNPVNYVFKELLAHFVAPPVSKERIREIREELEDVPQGRVITDAEIIYFEEGGEIDV